MLNEHKFIVDGPCQLKGVWQTAGSKNAILPILAASILNIEGDIILSNVPDITDVTFMLEILDVLNIDYKYSDNNLIINSEKAEFRPIEQQHTSKLRASFFVLGPCISRFGIASIAPPGGDKIGQRPLDYLFRAFRKMDIEVEEEGLFTTASGIVKDSSVNANFSVGTTESIILASVVSDSNINIKCAASEPHVTDLCNFLNSMGAQINGIGTHDIYIHGVKKLKGTTWRIIPDYLESGTMAIAAAASKSEFIINDFYAVDNQLLLFYFDLMNQKYEMVNENRIRIIPSFDLQPIRVRTSFFPGFPTDLQSPMAVLLTQCNGISSIYETIYENRLNYLTELQKMGAKVAILNANEAMVIGPTNFYGSKVLSFDIRSGMTLLLAAIMAEGKTELEHVDHIDRGYSNIEERLSQVGVKIKREKS